MAVVLKNTNIKPYGIKTITAFFYAYMLHYNYTLERWHA